MTTAVQTLGAIAVLAAVLALLDWRWALLLAGLALLVGATLAERASTPTRTDG